MVPRCASEAVTEYAHFRCSIEVDVIFVHSPPSAYCTPLSINVQHHCAELKRADQLIVSRPHSATD